MTLATVERQTVCLSEKRIWTILGPGLSITFHYNAFYALFRRTEVWQSVLKKQQTRHSYSILAENKNKTSLTFISFLVYSCLVVWCWCSWWISIVVHHLKTSVIFFQTNEFNIKLKIYKTYTRTLNTAVCDGENHHQHTVPHTVLAGTFIFSKGNNHFRLCAEGLIGKEQQNCEKLCRWAKKVCIG